MGIDWKLYELGARFYQGRPKDGSTREVDLPPFLAEMLDRYQAETGRRTCTCPNAEPPWCSGRSYVFLGPAGGHFRRANYSTRMAVRRPMAGPPSEMALVQGQPAPCSPTWAHHGRACRGHRGRPL